MRKKMEQHKISNDKNGVTRRILGIKKFFLLLYTLCFTLILFYTLHLTLLHSAFKDTGWGTRPVGMGGAFTAVSNDACGILYNPAGIYQVKYNELNFMYAKLYTGLDTVDLETSYVACVFPVKYVGSFGLNWASFISAKQYREDTVSLTYARKINDLIKHYFRRKLVPEISLGLNIKYLQHSYILDNYTVDDPVFVQGKSRSNITIDFGLFSKPFPKKLSDLSFGIMLKNINQPDVGLKTRDIVPAEIRIGGAYKIKKFNVIKNILFSLDVAGRNQQWGKTSDKLNLCFGSEAWFANELIGLRFGVNSTELSSGLSIGTPAKIKYNRRVAKLKFKLQLDYAFLWPLEIQETTGSHRVSMSYKF
ncbi:MAG: hypothetical protein ABID79_02935 [Elusimicrobiota bacterium]